MSAGGTRPGTGSGPVGVGFIGTGMISDTYLENLTAFPDVRVLILGDLDPERARAQAQKWGVPESGSAQDVLDHPEVELVVNLTIPAVHAQVASQILAAGKHVWTEKPISVDRPSGLALLAQADQAGLLMGVAPDTVLGPGVQTARRAIARGDIGTPLTAQTVMQYIGPDIFHPNPEFLFAPGAGPLFDMGPYYITTLVQVFGPVETVAAFGSQSRATRTVQVGDRAGTEFPVQVPTHVSALARFTGGGVSQSVFSFQSPLARTGVVEIAGTEGTLVIPDPNHFTGEVLITRIPAAAARDEDPEWESIPITGVLAGRGLGVLDLARCVRTGRRPLASGELGYHVLDTLVSIDEAVTSGQTVAVRSTVDPVPPMSDDDDPFAATL
ncbi:Gfo/Idh/MocA family oxidoreductase [Nakamurella flavida]|uniref:Gfo/Idh/MocA family oxidoreductase n=1 Tax=Nakamurella flavida TaxID=363630 RepID=A0A939C7D5_9ACTN|nr:Gfo/Idh/MocA family oxidoreductase [Nakamurella flavida]MBM9478052.1 Gfo/Idh/MocA family oxidoreductase [Nakamurella flavida]MDP9778231.1 putative dehydrogenase [Nakamurella flavida]